MPATIKDREWMESMGAGSGGQKEGCDPPGFSYLVPVLIK